MTGDNIWWPGGEYCIQKIDLDYLKTYDINVEEYLGVPESDLRTGAEFPFRYDTKKLYGFCVPDFDSNNLSAISD